MDRKEAQALARAREGDQDAFRVLVEHHSRAVFRLAFRITRNETDAEDVVQDAFLRAYRGLKRFDQRAKFSTWIYRITTNAALDLIRKRRRHEDERATPVQADAPDPVELVRASNPAPDRLVLSSQMRVKVEASLSRLAPKERAAFVLRHFEGMSIEEIAGSLGVGTNAAKNNIFRAVQKMRRDLAPFIEAGSA